MMQCQGLASRFVHWPGIAVPPGLAHLNFTLSCKGLCMFAWRRHQGSSTVGKQKNSTESGCEMNPGCQSSTTTALTSLKFRTTTGQAKPDYEATSVSAPSNHFMCSGNFIRFTEWCFIHQAHLGCVPPNGNCHFGNGGKQCRRFGHANETLPRVLIHFKQHFTAAVGCYKAVLDQLVMAVMPQIGTSVLVNQTVPGLIEGLRLDLVYNG